jgi:hypothetical protein
MLTSVNFYACEASAVGARSSDPTGTIPSSIGAGRKLAQRAILAG